MSVNLNKFEVASLVSEQACPLCKTMGASLYHQDNNKRSHRSYYQCSACHLVYVPASHYLTEAQEKAEYDLHENKVGDEGYKRFLGRFWQPLRSMLPPSGKILEFGCGPGPVLASMMQEEGYDVALYDHFYHNEPAVLTPRYYNAVTATEVIEHVHNPFDVIPRLLSYLKPNGVLGLMTKQVMGVEEFKVWHYKNDLTHVCFYSQQTFNWLADKYDLDVTFFGADVILLNKKP